MAIAARHVTALSWDSVAFSLLDCFFFCRLFLESSNDPDPILLQRIVIQRVGVYQQRKKDDVYTIRQRQKGKHLPKYRDTIESSIAILFRKAPRSRVDRPLLS